MTYQETKTAIEKLGYRVLAQTCHPGGLVSYDAMHGMGLWPHGRKLAKGAPRKTPYHAMLSLHRACIERSQPKFTRKVTEV